MTDLVGKALGKYQVLERLGQGGMAEVYRAYQPSLDRHVAIKVLHTRLAGEANFIDRFRREATLVARLRHPHIVQVHDFEAENELYYMVMELVEGGTLTAELEERRLKDLPFTLVQIVQIFTALTGAIDYAHARGMIHRDLKPGNIMFTAEGQVVLTDFGIARILDGANPTVTGVITGTPAYMSPEQARGERGDERSDIYSLGIILYELVTGRVPFEGSTPFGVIMKHVNEPLPPPRTINPQIPEPVEQVITKALSKEPAARYPRAGELGRGLREAVGLTPEAALSTTPVTLLASAPQFEDRGAPTAWEGTLASTRACPYRGLFAFREEDAPFFFGREAFIEQLVQAVQTQPIVAVIGPSGSGKSSVVFAGLLPHLRQSAPLAPPPLPTPIAPHFLSPQLPSPPALFTSSPSPSWLITTFRPGSQPFEVLASTLIPLLEPQMSETDRLLETAKLARALDQGELPLYQVVERILLKHPPARRLLLVVDQFEELYTLCSEPDLRQRFLNRLLEVIDIQQFRPEPFFSLVLTLRADFLGQALTHRPFADALQNADIKLGPMTRQELGQAINTPAKHQGAIFETGLVARILDDVGDEPGNLPLLEFALTLLWERQNGGHLSHTAYDAIGQVEGALARYADEVYEGLTPDEQEEARQLFIQMVRPGEGTEDTRRLAGRAELSPAAWELAQRLANARLVVTSQDATGQETVEVVHEALIRGWERLRIWMNAERAFRVWQERLRAAVRQWQASQQDEGILLRGAPLAEAESWLAERGDHLSEAERDFIGAGIGLRERRAAEREQERLARERLRRRVILGLAAGLILALGLAVLAGLQWRRAEQGQQAARAAEATAVAERNQAQRAISRELATKALAQVDKRLDLALLLGTEAEQTADTSEARSSLLNGFLSNPNLVTFLRGHILTVQSVAFSPDGQTLASAGVDNSIILWDVATHHPLGPPLTGHTDIIWSVAFSPDGKTLASASDDKTVILWDVATRQPLGPPLSGHKGWVTSLAFSPDGKILASASADNTILLWDMATRQLRGSPLTGHTDSVWSVAFSPDGKSLATAGSDNTILLWDVATHQPLGPALTGHTDRVWSLAFSPDGQTLASASNDNTIILWDVATRQPLGPPLTGHTGVVRSVAFSPDGQTLASASNDKSIILWDVSQRQSPSLRLRLLEHSGRVNGLAFSPTGNSDSQILASASDDKMVILWDTGLNRDDISAILFKDIITSVSWQARACRVANRNLSQDEWQQFFGDEPYHKTCPELPGPGE